MTVTPDAGQQVAILSRILLTRPNLEKIIRKSDLDTSAAKNAADLVDDTASSLNIARAGGDNIYTIAFRYPDGRKARDVVQAALSTFIEQSLGQTRTGTDVSSIGRIDYLLGNTQTLTIRGDYRYSVDEPLRFGPLAPPASGGRTESHGGGVMLQLSSQFGQSVLNEAKVYLSGSQNDGKPYLLLPAGRLELTSELPSGIQSSSTLSFGGNNGYPMEGTSTARGGPKPGYHCPATAW